MFNLSSNILRSTWEIASQLTGNLRGTGDELENMQFTTDWSALPKDLALLFFSWLPENDLTRVSLVCRKWHHFTSLIFMNKQKLPLKFIDASAWRHFVGSDDERNKAGLTSLGLDLTTEPFCLLTREKINFLKTLSNQVGEEGVTRFTIPKGLSLRKLMQIAREPLAGNATKFDQDGIGQNYVLNHILAQIGDVEVKETYTIDIANSIFEGTSSGFNSQKDLQIEKLYGYKLPRTLEASALAILTYIISETRLFKNTPCRCAEDSDSNWIHIIHGPNTPPYGVKEFGGYQFVIWDYTAEKGLKLECLPLCKPELGIRHGAGAKCNANYTPTTQQFA